MAQATVSRAVEAAPRPSVAQIVRDWAAGLTPSHAPDMRLKGPLAWVRETKIKELLAALEKEGYR